MAVIGKTSFIGSSLMGRENWLFLETIHKCLGNAVKFKETYIGEYRKVYIRLLSPQFQIPRFYVTVDMKVLLSRQ